MPAPVTLPRLSWGAPAASPARAARPRSRLERRPHVALRRRPRRCRAGARMPSTCAATAPRRARSTTRSRVCRRSRRHGPRRRRRVGPRRSATHSAARPSVVSRAADPAWTRRLVLDRPGDPPHRPRPRHRAREPGGVVRRSHAPRPCAPSHPHWHEHDVELKALSAQPGEPVGGRADERAERGVGCAGRGIRSGPCRPTSSRSDPGRLLDLPTASPPSRCSANPRITMSVVAGAGHSPHRDKPEATIAALLGALAG